MKVQKNFSYRNKKNKIQHCLLNNVIQNDHQVDTQQPT